MTLTSRVNNKRGIDEISQNLSTDAFAFVFEMTYPVLQQLILQYIPVEELIRFVSDVWDYPTLFDIRPILEYFKSCNTTDAMDYAAKNGCMNVLEYLNEAGQDCSMFAGKVAARAGHWDVVEYLVSKDKACFLSDLIGIAARTGNCDILKYLVPKFKEHPFHDISIDIPARYGYIDVVKYLHQERKQCTSNAIDKAAEHGHRRVVKYLLSVGKKWTVEAMTWAAKNRDLEMVYYLHSSPQRPISRSSRAMEWACIIGDLQMVKYLHYINQVSPHVCLMEVAAENGKLEVLKYLHSIGTHCNALLRSECNAVTMQKAAEREHYDIVRYLIRNGFPGAKRLMRLACRNGNIEVVKCLLDIGRDCTDADMILAADHGRLELVQHLTGFKRFPTAAMDMASKNGHQEVVECLYDAGNQCTEKAMEWACKYDHLDVVTYLHSIKQKCTNLALYNAIMYNRIPIAHFLFKEYFQVMRIDSAGDQSDSDDDESVVSQLTDSDEENASDADDLPDYISDDDDENELIKNPKLEKKQLDEELVNLIKSFKAED